MNTGCLECHVEEDSEGVLGEDRQKEHGISSVRSAKGKGEGDLVMQVPGICRIHTMLGTLLRMEFKLGYSFTEE